jgi:hypothetical protein
MKFCEIQNFRSRTAYMGISSLFMCVHVECHFQAANWLYQTRKFEASVHIQMQHHPTSINVHYLIELRGIDGEIVLFVSTKTSVVKKNFSRRTKLRVVTVV